MATPRYSSNAFTDGGAFPVSLRALLRAGTEGKREPERSSNGRVVGSIFFDGGTFPHRLSHFLNRLLPRSRPASPVRAPKLSATKATEKARSAIHPPWRFPY
jgi:hypothetical protein